MTDDVNTQSVVTTTEAPAKPAAEGTGAQATQTADLDSLLSEFTQATAKPAPVPEQKTETTVPPDAVRRLEQLESKLAEKDFKEEINPVLERIRGDIPKDVFSNEEVLDLIDGRAKRDPRLQKAWLERAGNPGAWSKIEKALGQELSKKFSKLPDPNATEDRETVAAAVRGASQRAPEGKPPNFSNMTEGEFRKTRKELYGY